MVASSEVIDMDLSVFWDEGFSNMTPNDFLGGVVL